MFTTRVRVKSANFMQLASIVRMALPGVEHVYPQSDIPHLYHFCGGKVVKFPGLDDRGTRLVNPTACAKCLETQRRWNGGSPIEVNAAIQLTAGLQASIAELDART